MNKFKQGLQSFMKGRYGLDQLGQDLSWVAMALLLLSILFRWEIARYLALALLVFLYFRMFSKNFSKRYNENRLYTNWKSPIARKLSKGWKRLKDFPKYKYLDCPKCQREMRVPRGKKKIVVTCPKCHHKFDAKS